MSFYGYNPADYRTDLSSFSRATEKFGGALAMIPEINKERTDMMSNANYMKSSYDDTRNSFSVLANNDDILRQYAKITRGDDFDEAILTNEKTRAALQAGFLEQMQSKLATPDAYDRRGKGASLDGEVNTKSGLRGNSVFATGDMNKAYTMRLAQGMAEALSPYRELMIEKGLMSQMASAASNHLNFTPKEFQGATDNLDYGRMAKSETVTTFKNMLGSDDAVNIENLGSFNDILDKLKDEKFSPAAIERFKKENHEKYMSKATFATIQSVDEYTSKVRDEIFNADTTLNLMTNPVSVFELIAKRVNEGKEELFKNKALQDNPTLMQYAVNELDGKMKYDVELIKYFSSNAQSMMTKSRTGGSGESAPKVPTAYLNGFRTSIASTITELKNELKNTDPKKHGDLPLKLKNAQIFEQRLNALTDILSHANTQFTPEHVSGLLQTSFVDTMRGLSEKPELVRKMKNGSDVAVFATEHLKHVMPSAYVNYDDGVFTIYDPVNEIVAPLNFKIGDVLPGREAKTPEEMEAEKAARDQRKAEQLVGSVGETHGEAKSPFESSLRNIDQIGSNVVEGGLNAIGGGVKSIVGATGTTTEKLKNAFFDWLEKDPEKRSKFIPPSKKEMDEKELAEYIKTLKNNKFSLNKDDMKHLFRRENGMYTYNGDVQ